MRFRTGRPLTASAEMFGPAAAPPHPFFAGGMPADVSLAIGLSAAYFLAFFVVLALLHKDEGTWEKPASSVGGSP